MDWYFYYAIEPLLAAYHTSFISIVSQQSTHNTNSMIHTVILTTKHIIQQNNPIIKTYNDQSHQPY